MTGKRPHPSLDRDPSPRSGEIWRPVAEKEFTELYEVSNQGRVRLRYDRPFGCGGVIPSGHIMAINVSRKRNEGYGIVGFRNAAGRWKGFLVHRLVADAFSELVLGGLDINHLERNPDSARYPIVAHRVEATPGIPADNSTDNLWRTDHLGNHGDRDRKGRGYRGKTSQYCGVCWSSSLNRWLSDIWLPSKRRVRLGQFRREIDAAIAYDKAVISHGLDRKLNVVSR